MVSENAIMKENFGRWQSILSLFLGFVIISGHKNVCSKYQKNLSRTYASFPDNSKQAWHLGMVVALKYLTVLFVIDSILFDFLNDVSVIGTVMNYWITVIHSENV